MSAPPVPATRRSSAAGIAATLGAALLWGSSFSVNDFGLAFVDPATFSFLRFFLAGVVAVAVVRGLGRLDRGILRHRWFWGLAAANALAFYLQYVAQTMTTPARTALLVNTTAFAVAILERAIYGMRVGPRRWLAIVVGALGAAVLITGGDPQSLRGGQLLGDLCALAAGLTWSVYFVVNGRAVERHDAVNLAAWTFLATSLVLVPTLALDPPDLRSVPAAGWAAIAYTALFTTALAFGLWTWGLTRIRASSSAVLLLVEILVASLVSVALGRERFGYVDLLGAALLVAAVVGMSLLAGPDEVAPARAAHDAPP